MKTSTGRLTAGQWAPALVLFILMAAAIAGVFLYAPRDRAMGDLQRIFYFHVASAWVAFLAFGVTFGCSLGHLVSRRPAWDRRAAASAELGVLFCSVVLLTGPIWAKGAWFVYWTWDARLTTTLVLWLIYVAYLMLRILIEEPSRRALLSAVVAIAGFVNVPIVYMSIRWWRTQHPEPIILGGEGSGMDPRMLQVFLFCLVTFTALYAYLFSRRTRLAAAMDALDALHRKIQILSLRSAAKPENCGLEE